MADQHITPESLADIEIEIKRASWSDEGGAYDFVGRCHGDLSLMAAEIRRLWSENERLEKAVDYLARVASNGSFGPGGLRRGPQSWREEAEGAIGAE